MTRPYWVPAVSTAAALTLTACFLAVVAAVAVASGAWPRTRDPLAP